VEVMPDNRNRWEEYTRFLEKRVVEHPIQSVAATSVFSFVAGVNTICAIFGDRFLPYFNSALAVYAVTTSYFFVALLGFALVRVLRGQKKRLDGPDAS
jgi:hypothetical protein